MVNGQGPFVERFGDDAEIIFDDYWINYRTAGEAKQMDMAQPNYTDLDSYLAYMDTLEETNEILKKARKK